MDIGIRAIDKDGIVIYCNDVMGNILGHNVEDMLGKHLLEIHEELEDSSSTLLKAIKTGQAINNKIKPQTNHRGELTYLVSSNIPIKEDGEIVCIIEYIKTKESYGDLLHFLSKELNNNREEEIDKIKKNDGFYGFEDFLTIEKDLIVLIEKTKDMSLYDYNVLISGETGTGKEIIAQSIHNRSLRRNKPFVAQNCAAIPENLLESIFFGTVSGAFTGAEEKSGLFEQANGGTLLLDELNSLPVFLQAKLLRVLQEGKIRRIGGKEDIEVDVRVICTTNEKTEVLIKENRLRGDLFYRLGPIYIDIPPLRNRKADVDYLTRIFLKRESKVMKVNEPQISLEVKDFFRKYPWQGNVRELKNVVNYILLNSTMISTIELKDLPHYMLQHNMDRTILDLKLGRLDYHQKIIEFEKRMIIDALNTTKGNVSEASKILGIKRPTLQYKISKMNIT